MYKLRFDRDALKAYNKANAELTRRLERCFDQLQQNPLKYPQAIPLKNYENVYRWRVGDWRVLYQVDKQEQIVYVLQIVHRSKAYR